MSTKSKKTSGRENGKNDWNEPHAGGRWAEEHIAPKLPPVAQGMWERTRPLRTKKALVIFASVGLGLGLLMAIGTYLAVVKPIQEAVTQTEPAIPFIPRNGGGQPLSLEQQQEALARAKPPVLSEEDKMIYCNKLPYMPALAQVSDSPEAVLAQINQIVAQGFKYQNKAYFWCAWWVHNAEWNSAFELGGGPPTYTYTGKTNDRVIQVGGAEPVPQKGISFSEAWPDGRVNQSGANFYLQEGRWQMDR